MFDIGMSELMVIAVVAIIVVGPKDLPGLLRTGARYVGQIRNLARDFQSQIDGAIRETEIKESLTDVSSLKDDLNPMKDIGADLDDEPDYMKSARAYDEPDEDYIAEGEKLKGEAIDAGVPEDTSLADAKASLDAADADKKAS